MMAFLRGLARYLVVAAMILSVGVFDSWTLALTLLNLCLISGILDHFSCFISNSI